MIDTFNPFMATDIEKCKCQILEVITTNASTSLFMQLRKWPKTKDPETSNDTKPIDSCHYMPVDKIFIERYKFESEVDMGKLKEYERLSTMMCNQHKKPLRYNWNKK